MEAMKTIQSAGKHRWLWILAARIGTWSLTLGVLWALSVVGLAALGFGATSYYNLYLEPPPPEEGDFGELLVIICLLFGSFGAAMAFILGAIQGTLAGFYAPPREATKPFKSRFFPRDVESRCSAIRGIAWNFAHRGVAVLLFC
jgi:hypothetical protein